MSENYDYEWHVGGFVTNNEKLLEECATLFSAHYGTWSNTTQRSGERVRLSKNRIREWLKSSHSAVYMARHQGELIGYAIAVRLNIPNDGVVSWTTQLVVHIDYRHQDVAKNILYSIWGYSDDFARGVISSSPYAVRALEKATRRRCEPTRMKTDIKKILTAGAGQIPYINEGMDWFVDNNGSCINTEFFVDHSDIDAMLHKVTSEDICWKLGQLKEGWE